MWSFLIKCFQPDWRDYLPRHGKSNFEELKAQGEKAFRLAVYLRILRATIYLYLIIRLILFIRR